LIPTIDEFGGYSSRLRIPESSATASSTVTKSTDSTKKFDQMSGKDCGLALNQFQFSDRNPSAANFSFAANESQSNNLCQLLNINVDELALKIVLKHRQQTAATTTTST